jgi:hypothetical protein
VLSFFQVIMRPNIDAIKFAIEKNAPKL